MGSIIKSSFNSFKLSTEKLLFNMINKDRKFWDNYYELYKNHSVGYMSEMNYYESVNQLTRKETINIYKKYKLK